MNLYTDTSALIKIHVEESNSDSVRDWITNANIVATGLITRAEVSSGINRLFRMKIATQIEYATALNDFRRNWNEYHIIPITEQIVTRADFLICQFVLRGYDAIHLACALTWQEALGASVTLASFDGQLRDAAQKVGLSMLPE